MSIWADIDTYLETQVMLAMGPASSYSTLKIQAARIDDYWQLDQVAKASLFPFCIFRGYEMTQELDGHGDGELHTQNTYPYVMVCAVADTDRRQAKVDAQELLSRMRKFMRQRPVLNGLVSTDTERLNGVTIGTAALEVIGRLDQMTGTYYGIAILRFVVETNN